MTKYFLSADLDECLVRTVISDNKVTQMKADVVLSEDNMAVYFRPYLLEFLFAFVNDDPTKGPVLSHFELGLFTKGTQAYADPIIDQMLERLKLQYKLSQTQVNRLFKARLYREDLNDQDKDLAIYTQKFKINVDNILHVDDLITNFKHQPKQGIKINKFNYVKAKDTELLKLMKYLESLDTSG